MIVSRPDPGRSTRGNRRVPWNGSQFPRLHSRTRKAYGSPFGIKSLPIRNKLYVPNLYRKFGRIPFKTKTSLCPKKIVYINLFTHIPIYGKSSAKLPILLNNFTTWHNPPTKQLRQRKTKYVIQLHSKKQPKDTTMVQKT